MLGTMIDADRGSGIPVDFGATHTGGPSCSNSLKRNSWTSNGKKEDNC